MAEQAGKQTGAGRKVRKDSERSRGEPEARWQAGVGPRPPEMYKTLQRMNDGITKAADPLGLTAPLIHAQLAWLSHPYELGQRMAALSSDLWRLQWHSWNRMVGLPSEDPIVPHPEDGRFADPVWTDSASWDLIKEWYLALTRHTQDMLYDTPALSGKDRRRAAFWWRIWLNAMAPTNFLFTNPVALRKAVETNGQSLRDGWDNFVADMRAGDVRMSNTEDFKVGENLANTPGSVIFRNRLLEVIHYAPARKKVHAQPVVFITPWINKFYVLDLNPKRSMVRFMLEQGFDVYITSWKNPDASMSEVAFDDYLLEGLDTIIRVAREFSGADKVHAVGYCIGGTALSMYLAWANRHYGADAVPVADWTLFTTLVDFREPGDIEVFIDEGSIDYLCDKMSRTGFLDGKDMAASFRLLRSNSLIWQYVVNGWLCGDAPKPFDVLYWNMDSTRMPYAMHAWYLRELYLHNRLVKPDALEVAGEQLDLAAIGQPLYAVGAIDDHIAPWRQTFLVNNHVTGERRYVLSSSGHILGILNPVVDPPKRRYWVDDVFRSDTSEAWYQRAEEFAGSWWEDWMKWLKPRAGEMVDARPAASKAFPELVPAPGNYVRER